MSSMVWPCFAARVPMDLAMLPEPMMLMVVMTRVPSLYGSDGRGGLACALGRDVEGTPATRDTNLLQLGYPPGRSSSPAHTRPEPAEKTRADPTSTTRRYTPTTSSQPTSSGGSSYTTLAQPSRLAATLSQ